MILFKGKPFIKLLALLFFVVSIYASCSKEDSPNDPVQTNTGSGEENNEEQQQEEEDSSDLILGTWNLTFHSHEFEAVNYHADGSKSSLFAYFTSSDYDAQVTFQSNPAVITTTGTFFSKVEVYDSHGNLVQSDSTDNASLINVVGPYTLLDNELVITTNNESDWILYCEIEELTANSLKYNAVWERDYEFGGTPITNFHQARYEFER